MFIKIKNIILWIRKLLKQIKKDHISEYSAQCAYYTILSFIPFIVLVLSLIQYTGIKPQILLELISKIVPQNMNEIIIGIVQEVYSKSIGTISISIIFTIWSAGKGLYALTKGLHNISINNVSNNKEENISYSYLSLRLKSIIQTIIFIILIVLSLIALVFGESLKNIIVNNYGILLEYNTLLVEVIYLIMTFLVFLLLYKFITIQGKKVTFRSQIHGALFGAISLNVISFIFSKYLYIFEGFSIMYGSLTTLMLVMMWTYACFYIVFLGAEINKVKLQN